jgi:predicted GH43/DUF377 family glycosyl hydrolase
LIDKTHARFCTVPKSQPLPRNSHGKRSDRFLTLFVEGLLAQKNRYLLYYGGADKYVGVAATETLYTK